MVAMQEYWTYLIKYKATDIASILLVTSLCLESHQSVSYRADGSSYSTEFIQ